MSGALATFVVEGYRWGSNTAPWQETAAIFLVSGLMTAACVLVVARSRRRDSRSPRRPDQWRALAAMGELCPQGWQARITLRGREAPMPQDAPSSQPPAVEVEWRHFEAGRPTVARRLWVPTMEDALQGMLEDRRTDLELERIEREAGAS